MDKQDVNLFRTYTRDVQTVSTLLHNTAEGLKDKEMRRFLQSCADDLDYVTADMVDTIERL